jgi:hypothetical protein
VRVLPVVVALAVVAVCASAATAVDRQDATRAMVLQLGDLPAGFGVDERRQVDNATAAREAEYEDLADFKRWGRLSGYEATFTREGLTDLLQVVSAASMYRTVRGARDSLRRRSRTQPSPTTRGSSTSASPREVLLATKAASTRHLSREAE